MPVSYTHLDVYKRQDFVVGSAALALRQNADINLVGENTLDGFVCPFCGIAGFEDGIKLHTGGMLVFLSLIHI